MGGKKKIAIDMLLNIAANAIPVFALQLLILPSLSNYMGADAYGLLVTVLALLNVVSAAIGNALNNIRLICGDQGAAPDKKAADYQMLLLLMALANLIIVAIAACVYEKDISPVGLLLTLTASVLWLFREYYIVAFRIKINYIGIVISNLLLTAGYLTGFGVFCMTRHWQAIYISGYLFSLLFILARSDLWKEPLSVSPRFKEISWQAALLLASGMLARVTTYADKLLIFPILGGAAVSVYYAATLFGKVVSMVITPVSGVMLSYLAGASKKNDGVFKRVFSASLLVCVVGYCVCIAASRPVLMLLHPEYAAGAMEYIFLTTATAVLSALTSAVNPFVLKFFDMKWQASINAAHAAIYVTVSMPLLSVWGLYGFCIGALASAVIKLLFMLAVYFKCHEKSRI